MSVVEAALRQKRGLPPRLMSVAVFTDPEVASVGLTEQEALTTGSWIQVGKQLFRHVGRAIAVGRPKDS